MGGVGRRRGPVAAVSLWPAERRVPARAEGPGDEPDLGITPLQVWAWCSPRCGTITSLLTPLAASHGNTGSKRSWYSQVSSCSRASLHARSCLRAGFEDHSRYCRVLSVSRDAVSVLPSMANCYGETHCAGVGAECPRPVTAPAGQGGMTGLMLDDLAFIGRRR